MGRGETWEGTAERGAGGALTCRSGSKAANRVAFAQGPGAQGLRAPLRGPRCPRRPGPAAAVPVIEPQHVLRHLVVRPQHGARTAPCRAVAGHRLAELGQMLLQPLSPREAHAEAAQPQAQQPARPGHGEVPAARPLLASRGGGTLRGREGPGRARLECQTRWGESARSPDRAGAGQRPAPLCFGRWRVADRQVGASLAAARFSPARGSAGALFPRAPRESFSRGVCGSGCPRLCLYPHSPLYFRAHPSEARRWGPGLALRGAPSGVRAAGLRALSPIPGIGADAVRQANFE